MTRRLLPRVAALAVVLAIGVAAVVGLELVLRVLDLGGGDSHDSRNGFSRLVPAFRLEVRGDGTRVYRLDFPGAKSVVNSFLAEKPAGDFRIFVVGASSAAGVPYTYDESFTRWLARRLEAELPDVPIEVVNAATSGYASRRLRIRVAEIARHEPDLLIIYSGHVEFAERLFYAELIGMHPDLFRVWEVAASTRLYKLAVRSWQGITGTGGIGKRPARHPAQMFSVHAPTPSAQEVADLEREYVSNIEAMIDSMRNVGARVMLLSISQNFADWPPGRSTHREGLTPEQIEEWELRVAEGDRHAPADCAGALQSWGRALAIDREHAGLHYEIGRCQRALGRFEDAQPSFRRASDLDRALHGAPTRYNEVLADLAEKRGTLFLDIDAMLANEEPIVGDNLFADLLHPNVRAHQLIAKAIAVSLREEGLPVPGDRWNESAYEETDLRTLYEERPDLRMREHLTRLWLCQITDRECRFAEAEAILALDPENTEAKAVLATRRAAAP